MFYSHDHLLLPSKKSEKSPLDKRRVKLMFDLIDKRFDKKWDLSEVTKCCNQKCRDAVNYLSEDDSDWHFLLRGPVFYWCCCIYNHCGYVNSLPFIITGWTGTQVSLPYVIVDLWCTYVCLILQLVACTCIYMYVLFLLLLSHG